MIILENDKWTPSEGELPEKANIRCRKKHFIVQNDKPHMVRCKNPRTDKDLPIYNSADELFETLSVNLNTCCCGGSLPTS